jgi:hypothetical protein
MVLRTSDLGRKGSNRSASPSDSASAGRSDGDITYVGLTHRINFANVCSRPELDLRGESTFPVCSGQLVAPPTLQQTSAEAVRRSVEVPPAHVLEALF